MNTVIWIMVATTAAFLSPVDECKKPTPRQDECLCDILFSRYIQGGKNTSHTVVAAIELLTRHGRRNGYWRTVLDELRKGNRSSERRCVTVLGKMLAIDAQGRAFLALSDKEQRRVASAPSVALDEEVVLELLKRAQQADRLLLDFYVIALARAHDGRTRGFFTDIVSSRAGVHHDASTRFHAAVGLAQLGDEKGVEWLIDYLDDTSSVFHAWPPGFADYNLGTCCSRALLSLTQQTDLFSKAAWRKWWDSARDGFFPKHPLVLIER